MVSKEAMKLACKALRDCHYYMINAGLPNQSLLNEAFTAYMELEAALAEQPAPPPECQTEAEKTAYAFGWWKALESVRQQPAQQEPVIGKGKELSEQLKLCARNVAFVAAGRVDMSSAAMQEMFALIDHVCVGIDSPPAQRTWVGLIRGVRVYGDTVVIAVKGGNDAARELCGALLKETT